VLVARTAKGIPGVVDAAGEIVVAQVLAQADELLPSRAGFERDLTRSPEIIDSHFQGLPAQQSRRPGPQPGRFGRRAIQKLPRHPQQFPRRGHFNP
jgi:hypothetical protein